MTMTNVYLHLSWFSSQLFPIYFHWKLYKIANIANFVYVLREYSNGKYNKHLRCLKCIEFNDGIQNKYPDILVN